MKMDEDWFLIIVGSVLYLGIAIRAGIRMCPDEARRFLRIEVVAGVLLLVAVVPAADSVMESLPDFVGIPLAVAWVGAFAIAFYSLFLGLVLLFRGALRPVGIRILCTAGIPFSLLYVARLRDF